MEVLSFFAIPDNSFWDTDETRTKFALATIHGAAYLFEGSKPHITATTRLCNERLSA